MNQDMLLPLHIITSHLTISAHFSINLPTYSKWIPPSTRYLLNSLSVINNIIANITNTIIVINIAKFLVVQTLVIIFIFIITIISQTGHLLTGLLVTSWGVFPTLTECWPYGQTACQFQVVEKTNKKAKYHI